MRSRESNRLPQHAELPGNSDAKRKIPRRVVRAGEGFFLLPAMSLASLQLGLFLAWLFCRTNSLHFGNLLINSGQTILKFLQLVLDVNPLFLQVRQGNRASRDGPHAG